MFIPKSRATVLPSARPLAITLALALAAGCEPGPDGREGIETSASAAVSRTNLLQRWAPVHYQDVNKGGGGKSLGGKADYVVRFDYEPSSNAGDHWNSWDKWDNLGGGGNDLRGYVYTDVSESPTHWFLYYMMYHPRDWSAGGEQEHENDAEGILLFVRKDGTQFGRLEGMLTQAHGPMIPFSADLNTVVPRTPGRNETVQWESYGGWSRPRTYQEAEGHGLLGCGHPGTKCDKGDEDGIRYVPGGFAETPGTVGLWTSVSYALGNLNEFWERRNQPLLFNQDNGKFNGNKSGGCGEGISVTCATTAANPMWQWEGNLATDPAAFVAAKFEFRGVAPPSGSYPKNDYRFCEDLTRVKSGPGHTSQSCNPECSRAIIAADPYCGDHAWDDVCVSQIESVCGIQISR
jgi:hypothetical protein